MAAKSNLTNMVLVLGLVCLLCSGILGGAYALTKAPIDAAAAEKTQKAVAQVLPAFETVSGRLERTLDGKTYAYYEATASDAAPAGYAIESTVVGFGGNLTLIVGVTPDRVVCNTSVLSHSETPGLGAKCATDPKFTAQWKGLDPSVKKLSVKNDGGDIDAITASTITSRAYTLAVENALAVFDALQADKQATDPNLNNEGSDE